ncbi:putative short chain dehydrogenase/reductase [Whalleya microplaca]|nr:putative short chain dehydrogenase/reductase [Whalleya microplaca]
MASNKTVILVTGANIGIGYETVVTLSKVSANFHILLGSRSIEKGQKALSDIQSTQNDLQGTISVIQIDVTDQKSIQAAKEQIEAQFGKLDVLINNAGIVVYEQLDTLTALRRTFETNAFGPMILTETLEPLLKKAANPYVIYVSSELGSVTLRLDPNSEFYHVPAIPYRMSKAALDMLAACHRYSYASWKCKVLAFDPGYCVSNLTGEGGRETRIKDGARDPKQPANVLVDIVLGNRDADIEKNGMMNVDGRILPW